jgi:hypothetical protein
MAKIPEYHTNTDPEDPVYHVYDDCPTGKRVIANGNNVAGTGGFVLCTLCKTKPATGHF